MPQSKTKGLRKILIYALTRQQLIDFIKRKSSFYTWTNFVRHSDSQLRAIAFRIDEEVQENKIKKTASRIKVEA